MDRQRGSRPVRSAPGAHRALMNDARRQIERYGLIAAAAAELAEAAQAILDSATVGRPLNLAELTSLRAALARYRESSR